MTTARSRTPKRGTRAARGKPPSAETTIFISADDFEDWLGELGEEITEYFPSKYRMLNPGDPEETEAIESCGVLVGVAINGPENETRRDDDLNPEARACLEILIREIQDILAADDGESAVLLSMEIEGLLKTWIDGNDLHPEGVGTLSIADLTKRFVGPASIGERAGRAKRAASKRHDAQENFLEHDPI